MANKHDKPTLNFSKKPLLIGLLAFVFFLIAGFFMLWQRYQILVESRQSEMSSIINLVEQNIDQSLKYSYSAALSLALQIDEEGKIDNFDEVAPQLVDNNPNIDAIETVPGGVIKEVYPYEENKAAINYNILADSTRNEEALKAIDRRRMFFAGPLELKQGGFAIVGRLPVFIKDEFWGFVAVLIDFDNLVDQSGVRELVGDEFNFQFSKVNPVSGEEEFFLDSTQDLSASYSEEVVLPDGDWKIYIIPADPNSVFLNLIPVSFLILFLSGALAWIIYNTMKQPVLLEAKLDEQAAELEQSERRFRIIFNQAAIGMARVNSRTGMILETNKRFQKLLGYNSKELKKMDYKMVSHPEDLDENTELMRQLRENKIREYSLEKRLKRANGETIWVRLNVSALWEPGEKASSHIALIEDISARVKAKQELVDNEKRFRSLVENSNEVILIINKNGETLYSSPSLKRITGYNQLLLSGNDIFTLIHPDDRGLLLDGLRAVRANPGKAYPDIVMRVKTIKNEWIWVNTTLNNLLKEKNIEGYVINLRNITEKKEAEINLVKSYELVMEQNKRLLNFAYIVSHNLRSHSSNLESILELYEIEESREEKDNYVSLLKKVSKNLGQSLHDLNEVVSINTKLDIEAEQLKVADYVKNTLDVLGMQINSKKAKVETNIPDEMLVAFNPAYMESILLNFITNALRYTHADSRPEVRISGYKKDCNWVLEVCDNGIGIDMEQHGEKVFGLYKTFSERKDSRGVGLFITKNQVEAMGGRVDVESKPGEGSCFKVIFK